MKRAPLTSVLVGLAIVATLGSAACAAPSSSGDSSTDDSADALVNGQPAGASQFPSTLYMKSGCTVTKVAPKRLLTAAHCVWSSSSSAVSLLTGSTISVSREPAAAFTDVVVAAVDVHPSWAQVCEKTWCAASTTTTRIDAADVAVIELATDLADVPVTSVDAAPVEVGERVTILGFGCTDGVLVPDARGQTTLKFGSTHTIAAERAVHAGSAVVESDVSQVGGIYNLTPGPGSAKGRAGLCPGDSGGPLFRSRDGKLLVVGVNSNYTFRPEDKDQLGMPVTNWHTKLDEGSRHGVAAWLRSVGVETT